MCQCGTRDDQMTWQLWCICGTRATVPGVCLESIDAFEVGRWKSRRRRRRRLGQFEGIDDHRRREGSVIFAEKIKSPSIFMPPFACPLRGYYGIVGSFLSAISISSEKINVGMNLHWNSIYIYMYVFRVSYLFWELILVTSGALKIADNYADDIVGRSTILAKTFSLLPGVRHVIRPFYDNARLFGLWIRKRGKKIPLSSASIVDRCARGAFPDYDTRARAPWFEK